MPHKSHKITLNVPEANTEREFLRDAQRLARQEARRIYRTEHQLAPKKRGRPPLREAVFKACDAVWKEWGGAFPKNQSSIEALVKKVSERIPRKKRKDSGEDTLDLETIRREVKEWGRRNLHFRTTPDSYLRKPKGQKITKFMLQVGVISETVRSQGGSKKGSLRISGAAMRDLRKQLDTLRSLKPLDLTRLYINHRKASDKP